MEKKKQKVIHKHAISVRILCKDKEEKRHFDCEFYITIRDL